MSPEFKRKQRERLDRRRSDKDGKILRFWLVEDKSIEQIAPEVGISPGAVHGHLQRIFGARVKGRVVFSRGELVTDLWVNRLCARFGGLKKLRIGRLFGISGDYLQDVGAVRKNRAITCDKAKPLVSGEGKGLDVVANADGDRADYLRFVVPDLAQKRDGAVLAIKLAHDVENGAQDLDAGLNELAGEARNKNVAARIALAWLPQVTAWFASLEGKKRSLSPGELARMFVAEELNIEEHVIKEALSRSGPVETKPGWIRHMIVSIFREKELEAKLAARAKGGAPKKENPKCVVFGNAIEAVLPKFTSCYKVLAEAKRKFPFSINDWKEALRKIEGLSQAEMVDAVLTSRNPRTAAIRYLARVKAIKFKTAKNLYSQFLARRKGLNEQ